jgi:hypothetical protein
MTAAQARSAAGSPLTGAPGAMRLPSSRPQTGRVPLEPEDLGRLATAAYLLSAGMRTAWSCGSARIRSS